MQNFMAQEIPTLRQKQEENHIPIQLAIWDVGGVILEHSMLQLFELALIKGSDPQKISERMKNFKEKTRPYMRGDCNYEEFCMDFCEHFGIRYYYGMGSEILGALRRGFGDEIEITRKTVHAFVEHGIDNAILSNALPIVSDEPVSYSRLFPKNYRFFSFETGFIKPESQAWQTVLDITGVEPENMLFIDDKLENVRAAIKMGIASILFEPRTFREELRYQLPNTFDHGGY